MLTPTTTLLTLDAIVEQHEKGTLNDESDFVLYNALAKVEIYIDHGKKTPTALPEVIPAPAVLTAIQESITSLLQKRYGCND